MAKDRKYLESPNNKGGSLQADALSFRELLANNIANIAPAIAAFYVFGAVVVGAGVGAPLIILVAGIAMLFHANTTTEFAKVTPSSGFYATYISRGLGPKVGAWLASAYVIAFICSYVAVTYQIGVWSTTAVQATFGVSFPWWVASLAFQGVALAVCWRGIKISVRTTVGLFAFELLMLVVAAVAILVTHPNAISLVGFAPHSVKGGLSGLGLGFPLAIFLFVGSGASSPLAEEMQKPHKNLPRSIMIAITFAIVLFVFLAWVEGIGFNNNVQLLLKSPFPLITAATTAIPFLGPLMYLAGLTSAMAVLMSVVNGSARVFYNVAREGLLPRTLSSVHPRWRTPHVALGTSAVLAAAATIVLSLLVGSGNGFAYSATLGTDIYMVIYIVANIALLLYFWRQAPHQLSWIRHAVVPLIGVILLAYPLWLAVKPNQPSPYGLFGVFLMVVLVATGVYGISRSQRAGSASTILDQEH